VLVDPVAVVAAALAGVAAALWVVNPQTHLQRATRSTGPPATVANRGRISSRHPGAPPLRRRVAVSLLAGVTVWLALRNLTGPPDAIAWVAGLILLLVGIVGPGVLEPSGIRRHRQQLRLDTPQALELLSACLAAGMPLRRATAAVVASFEGPIADDLGAVLNLINLGVSDVEAWHTLRTHPQLGPAAIDLARSVESGTMMVQTLAHHARDARTRRRASLEVAAKAVGVRSVLPLMVCFLPAFLLLGIVPTVASAITNALF